MQSHIINILLGITSLITLSIAIFSFLSNKKNFLNVLLSATLLCGAGWSITILLTIMTSNLLTARLCFAFAAMMFATISLLFISFNKENFATQKSKIIISAVYLLPAVTLSVLTLSPSLFLHKVEVTSFGTLEVVNAGPLMVVFSLFVVAYTLLMIFSAFLAFRSKHEKTERLQLIYTTIGLGSAAFFSIAVNYVLPRMGLDRYNNLGPITMLFCSAFTIYAVTKHYLYDPQVIISEMWACILLLMAMVWLVASPTVFNGVMFILVAVICFRFIIAVVSEANKNMILKKQKHQLEKDKIELEKIDKLKDEFLQMATHELNTPIAVISGRFSLILDEDVGNFSTEQKEILRKINFDVERLSHLSKDILNTARIEDNRYPLYKTDFDLTSLVYEIVSGFDLKAKEKNLKIFFQPNSTELKINGDKSKIGEVVTNLLSNAVKFSQKDNSIQVKTHLENGCAVVSVNDQGIGMQKEDLAIIFNKFVQVNRFDENNPIEQQGSGLGLYIAKKIVDLHRGKIWVESEVNHGSTFYFSLPLKK